MRFDEAPLLVIWETKQADVLACMNCRASATPGGIHRNSQPRKLGPPMAFTGGDPLMRPDSLPLPGCNVELGLRTNISPGSTSLLTKEPCVFQEN
jgi:AdoMet-dependent heme synthase